MSEPPGPRPPRDTDPTPPGRPAAEDVTAETPSGRHLDALLGDGLEPPTRKTRSGPIMVGEGRPARDTHRESPPGPAGSTVRDRATPPPLPPLGARAGIHDPRDGLQLGPRYKPLDARTVEVRLNDVAVEDAADRRPAEEPLGQAPGLSPKPSIGGAARMVVFFGPKGGVGATTLACNVGGILARNGRPAVLVDLDLQLGAVPVSLGVQPRHSISTLVREAQSVGGLGAGPLRTELDAHPSGLRIAAQTRIEDLGAVTVKRLPRFFDALGAGFGMVLVDGLRDFNDHAVASMDLAHMVVIVITQDVPAVRAGARALRIFRRLGYKDDRLLLVVNRYHRRAPVGLDDIRRVLGMPVHARVHNDFPLIEQALNRGQLVEHIQPRSRPARDLLALAALVAGDVKPTPVTEERGLLGRLLGR